MSYNPSSPRPITSNNHNFHSTYSLKPKISINFPKDSRYTKQSFKDECDINLLMSRYLATGELPNLNEAAPQYLDVSAVEFQKSMEFIAGANTLFQELPSAIRNRFQNDPAAFLDFCSHEKNRPELAAMGLLRDEIPSPIPTPIEIKQTSPSAPTSIPATPETTA
ncbi:MAG: internal scaffolding protein [Microviridae sp.]|nr:MAG: internal scaffolding protein [Microviridae sp.]